MWTSREISQKASPWSKPSRKLLGPRAILGALLLLGLLFAFPGGLHSQEPPPGRSAILLEGPNLVRGVPALGANAFEAQRAVYELSPGEEVEIYLISLLVSRVNEWGPFSCAAVAGPEVTLNARERSAGTVYAYRNEAEQRTLIVSGSFPAEAACDFISSFLEELAFFSSALGSSPLLPFPAVLTY